MFVSPQTFASSMDTFEKLNLKLSPVERENVKAIYARGEGKGGPLAALVYLSYKKYSALDELFDRNFIKKEGTSLTTYKISEMNPKLHELLKGLKGEVALYNNTGLDIEVDNTKFDQFYKLVHAKIHLINVGMEPESEPRLVTFVPINYPAELSKIIVSYGAVGDINAHNKSLVDDINDALNVPAAKPSFVTQTTQKLGITKDQLKAKQKYYSTKKMAKPVPLIKPTGFLTRKYREFFGQGGTRRKRQLQASLE